MGFSASVLGASGYSGGEVLRLLARHPSGGAVALGAYRAAGADIASVHPHLSGINDGSFATLEQAAAVPADVCFSCLPSGALEPFLDQCAAPVVVDLSDEHRAAAGWVYGLTELSRAELASAPRIANPGCYPTAALLCLVPFARAGAIEGPVIVDALSGVSGAGRDAKDGLLFSGRDGSAGAYGTGTHRHVPEMERALKVFGGLDTRVSFTPHLVPMTRGLIATCRARLNGPLDDAGALEILRDTYRSETFVSVAEAWPASKAVAGTNRVIVTARVDDRTGFLVAGAAIDNLGKGAAGQAVQNANVALGIEEDAGLDQLAVWP